jgi:hypothetical protein
MKRIEENIVINRPCEEVFSYLENRSNDSSWMVAVAESQWLDTNGQNRDNIKTEIGRRGRMIMKIRGHNEEFIDEVTEYEPGRKIAHRTVKGPFLLNTACLCKPVADGCRATVMGEADKLVKGLFGFFMNPFIEWKIRRSFKADLARLKGILEGEA